jgi:hypothetical protein
MRNAIELAMAAIALASLGLGVAVAAPGDLAGHGTAARSPALQRSVDQAVARTLARTWATPLKADQLAVTAVDQQHAVFNSAAQPQLRYHSNGDTFEWMAHNCNAPNDKQSNHLQRRHNHDILCFPCARVAPSARSLLT